MPIFRYTTVAEDGTKRKGTVDVADRFAVYNEVRKSGETIVSVEEAGGSVASFDFMAYLNNLFARVKMDEKILLARNLAAMLDAGLSVVRALSVMEKQSKNPKMKKVLGEVGAEVSKGSPFFEALSLFPEVFSPIFIAMVKAGEESGGLGNALRVVSKQMERSYTLKRKIKGAMIYPAVIVVAMIGIGILMLIYVVPTLSQTFKELNMELPVSTRLIIGASDFLVAHTLLTLLLMAGTVAGFYGVLKTKFGRRVSEFAIIHMPVVGNLVQETNAARTARTMSSLLTSGVDMLRALAITREVVQNSYYQEVLKLAEEQVSHGGGLAKAFLDNQHLYPVILGEMISVGEETGKLSEMLEQIAGFYEEEVEQKTKDLSTIIEPFLMVFIGAGVGFFAISMISPIYSLSEGI